MVKSEREKAIAEITMRIFDTMVEEIVMDAALLSHHEVSKNRAICHVCHTRCSLDHTLGPLNPASLAVPSSSRHPTPSGDGKALNGSSGTGTNTPTSVKADGTVYFECVNCKRPIASNRYAPHLSSCMGIGTGTRRAANRSNVKSKATPDAGRSQSPYVASDNDNVSDDPSHSPAKGKGKSKSKRTDEAEFNLKRKRPGSPQISPSTKQSKKQKTTGSPMSRVRADSDAAPANNTYHLQSSSSQSKIPSKLRDSSIAPLASAKSLPSSRSTSPGTPIKNMPTPAFSAQSPPRPGMKKKGRPPKANGISKAIPPKRPSPPRPPPPPIRVPGPDYVDVEGEETGSSTDTDSS